MSEKIPLKSALVFILFSVILISGSSFLILLYYQEYKEKSKKDERYLIKSIIQTSASKENLKTAFLIELLGLSIDQPVNFYQFNTKDAENLVSNYPLIEKASIKKIYPSTLYLYYTLREPIAFVEDYTNTAVDKEGYTFPFKPFFTPKKLPKIYLGLHDDFKELKENFSWGFCLKDKRFTLATNLIDLLKQMFSFPELEVLQIDVSKAFAASYGQRQIILEFEIEKEALSDNPKKMSLLIRLSTKDYVKQLHNFISFYDYLKIQLEKEKSNHMVLDLRITDLSFISKDFK